MSCDSGSWAGRRPRLGGYVTRMGPTDGATAAGGHCPQGNPVQFPDSHSRARDAPCPRRAPEDVARSPDRHRGTSRLANPALPRLRAADLQAGVEVPLLRHLARMGRPLVGLGAMAPSSLPTVDLMHPTQIAKPFHRAGWIYEEKVDGWRMAAIKTAGAVRLVSRNGRDLTPRFPYLVKAVSGLKPRAFILDGEVAVYDRAFISRFEWLRRRPTDQPATLPVYMVFDLLELDGRDLRKEPF
jgi:ATP dependent DNA ligase-like protein